VTTQLEGASSGAELQSEREFLAWALHTLIELNPSNYDHDDACACSSAAVEVMLAIDRRLATPASYQSTAPSPSAPDVVQQGWLPIESAPKDGTPLHLFSEGFIDEDFNPSGVIEGSWCDGWIGAVWNGYTDQYDTNEVVPTHYRHHPAPPPTLHAAQHALIRQK
jgi:hypothetical protein